MHRQEATTKLGSPITALSSSFCHAIPVAPIATTHPSGDPLVSMSGAALARVRLCDVAPYDGAPNANYLRAVDALAGSLMRHNAAVIEMGSEDAALMRCGLEAARLYFRSRSHNVGKTSRGLCMYRAGRSLEDWDSSPPCMGEIFRCMGKAARAALSAIAKHLRLRSDVFNHLLDDHPLPLNEVSSSVLVATHSSHAFFQNNRGIFGGAKSAGGVEAEKGLLTLISSDGPGLQVCDPNGRWYLADSGCGPGDLLLITGKALSHATAGLRPAASCRAVLDNPSASGSAGRVSLVFKLMPQYNAILDCSAIEAAGHVIPQSYVPISVSQFMDDLSTEEEGLCNRPDNTTVMHNNQDKEPSLRSVLSDPISGAFLEDAVVIPCGHSFGGLMLKRVIEMSRCTHCCADVEIGSLIPNYALRNAATAVRQQDDRRLFHNASQRRRRKEMGDPMDMVVRMNREDGEGAIEDGFGRTIQYPFVVNEKVLIKGNKRTPEKFVGKEAVITSQCLNGWYLLRIIGSGENVRLQYRSLQKLSNPNNAEDRETLGPIHNNSS